MVPSVRPTNVRAGQSFPAIPELLPNSPGALTLEPCVFQRKNRCFWRRKSSLCLPIFLHTLGSACFSADGRVSLLVVWAWVSVGGGGGGGAGRSIRDRRHQGLHPPPSAISADYHPTHRQHCSSSTASSSTCTMSWLLFRDP